MQEIQTGGAIVSTQAAAPKGLLMDAENEQGAAKVGIFGDQGSGKTSTAALLTIGFSKEFHGGKPVAFFDTERGSDFILPMFRSEGVQLRVFKGRAFKDLLTVMAEAERAGCCAILVDSITHVWTDVVDSYCKKRNISRPEFHHWRDIKGEWQKWPDVFLNSPLHCAVSGRSGFEYEYQENEETHKKELIKGDTKMRVEGQFGYEPHLLIEMERVRETGGEHVGGRFIHRAHVLKDRSWAINGKHFDFPDQDGYKVGYYKKVLAAFMPHFQALNIGHHKAVAIGDSQDVFDGNGKNDYSRKAQEKAIALEECIATMQILWPGQDVKTKTLRINVLDTIWGTRAWGAVENMGLEQVQSGLKVLREFESRSKDTQLSAEEDIVKLLKTVKISLEIIGQAPAGTIAMVPRAEIPTEVPGPSHPQIQFAPVKAEEHSEEDEKEPLIEIMRMNGDLYLSGDTFIVKDQIKSQLGGRWDKERKSWKISAKKHDELKELCDAAKVGLYEDI
jgi:hypothetical protein